MSLNPLRLVKSLWRRPHPATHSVDVNQDASHLKAQDGERCNYEQPQAEVEEPALSPITKEGFEVLASASPPNVANSRLKGPLFDNHDASARLDDEESEDNNEHEQSHARHPSIASSVTLNHVNVANEREAQTKAEDDLIEDVFRGEHYREGRVPEVSSDEDDQANDGASQGQHHTASCERHKLRPEYQQDRWRKPTSSQPRHDYTSDAIVEESTNDDPLPEVYLYTFRSLRCVKPSMKLTGSCGPEQGLHRLICGHWISTPTRQPCGVNCHPPSSSNEAFRCSACCATVQTILGNIITAAEEEKLQQARNGSHIFYIALAVEYVCKHSATNGGVTEAIIHSLDGGGRVCAPSDGPKDYTVSLEHTRRATVQNTRTQFEAESSLARHDERDAVMPTRQKCDTRPPKASSASSAHRRKRRAAETDADSDGERESAERPATPVKVLHGGATSSPHFARAVGRLGQKRRCTEAGEELAHKKTGKRRCVLKGPVWKAEE